MPLDYKQTEDGDLYFNPDTGDLEVVESTLQHQKDLLEANKGDYRESPETGVGLLDWLEDDAIGDLPGVIQEQFEADGMNVKKVEVTQTGKLTIDADY